MSAGELPEGFLYVSRRFRTRVESRFFGAVTRDPHVMPELSPFDSAEVQKKKLAQHERHLRKVMARIRRNAAITGKAGRKPEPETLELYQAHFVEGKPWKVCFEELWSNPGRSRPCRTERTRFMRRLRGARQNLRGFAACARRDPGRMSSVSARGAAATATKEIGQAFGKPDSE